MSQTEIRKVSTTRQKQSEIEILSAIHSCCLGNHVRVLQLQLERFLDDTAPKAVTSATEQEQKNPTARRSRAGGGISWEGGARREKGQAQMRGRGGKIKDGREK